MAGKATGFLRSKFKYPRYGVEINGISILERSLRGLGDANYYFICLSEQFKKYGMQKRIMKAFPGAKILLADCVTHGQALTALWAEQYVSTDDPLMIVSPMQVIDWEPQDFYTFCENTEADAAMVTTDNLLTDSELFYTKVDMESGMVKSVSDSYHDDWMHDCGIYYFKYGWYYTRWVKEMMKREGRIGSEFWVSMCMNDAIVEGKEVRPYIVDSACILKKANDVRQFAKHFPEWSKP